MQNGKIWILLTKKANVFLVNLSEMYYTKLKICLGKLCSSVALLEKRFLGLLWNKRCIQVMTFKYCNWFQLVFYKLSQYQLGEESGVSHIVTDPHTEIYCY